MCVRCDKPIGANDNRKLYPDSNGEWSHVVCRSTPGQRAKTKRTT